MSWLDRPIFFIDFEGSRSSGVLEYGVVTLLGGRVTETRTRLCGATGKIRPEDTAVHGLDAAALAAHRPLADDWEYFAGLRERGPLAAHYAGVENGLLKSVWPFPRSSPDFARPGRSALEWGPWIDSARIYAQVGSAAASAKLETLVAAHGLQAELDALAAQHCPAGRRAYHGALYDALGGALLLGALARQERFAGLTLVQLFALSTLDGGKRDALTQGQLW
ncbi:MAG TPA: 3'-5' exonuclease [Opitutaceae bacterium]|nr:3'-5' exonuclease [Opitutaceae bacterium]